MSNQDDRPSKATPEVVEDLRPTTPPTRLLHKLRRVLFEETSTVRAENEAASAKLQSPLIASGSNSELEAAALSALRDVLSRELGASAAEFTLQVEALNEVIPDLDTRRRAALSVLAKKGFTQPQLCLELERALAFLSEQQGAFLEKLKARRDEHTTLAAEIERQCAQATEAAGQEVERLQAALEAAHQAQSMARSEREQRLQTLTKASDHLTESELAFSDAYQRIQREYQALREQLARPVTEKFQ